MSMTNENIKPYPAFDRYMSRLHQVESGELVIAGWDSMSEHDRTVALDAEYAENLDRIARVKYQPLASKG